MTFSVAGYCESTGALGAIVTSSSPAVGARCAWVKSNTGVVLTQNVTDPRLADIAFSTIENQYDVEASIQTMKAATQFVEYRQLAVVNANGNSATFTGKNALGIHGEFCTTNVASVGNLLSDSNIPSAMGQQFLANSDHPLADRLLSSIQIGFEMGGELDQEHSIALLIAVPDLPFPYVDLRVDYSDSPLNDLIRLWEIYGPQAEDYKVRALNPNKAPSYGVKGNE